MIFCMKWWKACVCSTFRSIISCSSCTMSSLRLSCRVDILCSSSSLRCLTKETSKKKWTCVNRNMGIKGAQASVDSYLWIKANTDVCFLFFFANVSCASAQEVTWEVVAQPAGWGSADPCQVVAGTPPRAEDAAAEFPAGFLCDRHQTNSVTRPGYLPDIDLFKWSRFNRKYRETTFD